MQPPEEYNTFQTEKEVEQDLELETRTLNMPCGRKEVVSTFKLYWHHYDFFLDPVTIFYQPEAELLDMIDRNYKEAGCDFKSSFEAVIGYMCKQIS